MRFLLLLPSGTVFCSSSLLKNSISAVPLLPCHSVFHYSLVDVTSASENELAEFSSKEKLDVLMPVWISSKLSRFLSFQICYGEHFSSLCQPVLSHLTNIHGYVSFQYFETEKHCIGFECFFSFSLKKERNYFFPVFLNWKGQKVHKCACLFKYLYILLFFFFMFM